MAHNLKFSEAVLDQSYCKLVDNVRCELLKGAVKAFVSNMDRVVALLKVSGYIYTFGLFIDMVSFMASKNIYGSSDKLLNEMRQCIQDKKYLDEQYMFILGNVDNIIKLLNKEGVNTDWMRTSQLIDNLLGPLESTPFPRGLEAVLSGAVLGSWTAFETLASDLWSGAIDAHPGKLAQLSGKPNRITKRIRDSESTGKQPKAPIEKKSGNTDDTDDDKESKLIKLNDITKITLGDYNLSGKMGILLLYFQGHC